MPDSQNPSSPNFVPGVGRLVTDRYDFQSHVDGANFRHNATQIDLSPTLVIGGNTIITTQDAITALANIISPPTPVLATSATPGLVQLSSSGDIHGTATNLRVTGLMGYPINTTAPAINNVLTWNGIAWGPAVPASFTAAGDLSGNNITQQVVGLTGDTTTHIGFHTIRSSADYIQFINTARPTITQLNNVTGTSATMTIRAQSSSVAGNVGGRLLLGSGNWTGLGGYTGALTIATGGITVMEAFTNYSGLEGNVGFFPSNFSSITTTDMPANSGDSVIYIGNCNLEPTTPSPTGSILYSSSGKLNVMQADGSHFTITNNATLSGDVTGTATANTVINLTGSGAGTVNFIATATSPQLGQVATSTASAIGNKLVIRAQDATGTTSTGGDLALSSGTGTSANGIIHIQNGLVDVATFDLNKFTNLRGLRRNFRSSSISSSFFTLDDIVELTATGLTATLPSSPTVGDKYTVCCNLVSAGGTFAISGNGKNILYKGVAGTPLTITVSTSTSAAISFIYDGTEWIGADGF